MADPIECRGINNILDVYELHSKGGKIPYYALFNGTKLRFPFTEPNADGRPLLQQTLDFLKQANTNAVYELRFYKDLDKSKTITTNTPYTSSFTFIVKEPEQQIVPVPQPMQPAPKEKSMVEMMAEKIVEKQLSNIYDQMNNPQQPIANIAGNDDNEPEDPIKRIIGYISEASEIPMVQDIVYGLAKKFKIPMEQPQYEQESASIAGLEYDLDTEDEQLQLAYQAVQELYKVDKEIGTTLQKLAVLAKNKPVKYQMAKGFL